MNAIAFPSDIEKIIVQCIEAAVGDDILADIQSNDLKTTNSVPSRIWDLLNSNLFRALGANDCLIAKTHRGPWEMLVIFESTTKCIMTFMREKRFSELQRNQAKRNRMHYLDIFAKQFNQDLLASTYQMSLLPHEFTDADQLTELVRTILHDLECGIEVVQHHVLVLFDTAGYQLTSVRAVMVTPSLHIAQDCEQDWTAHISASESIVVTKVSQPDLAENQPNRGLSLKAKAIERQKNKPPRKTEESEENSKA